MTNLDVDALEALVSDASKAAAQRLDAATKYLEAHGFSCMSLVWNAGDVSSVRPVLREGADEHASRTLIEALSRLVGTIVAAVIEVGRRWHIAMPTQGAWMVDDETHGTVRVSDLGTVRARCA